jgi:hypothetical protein
MKPLAMALSMMGILAATTAAASPAAAGPASTIPGDGTFLVGTDFTAGVFRSTGNSFCYWQRSKDASGTLDSIIANDIGSGQRLVYVRTTDKVFKTSGCSTWKRVLTAEIETPSKNTTIPGDGSYLVGADFLPGTYRSSGNTGSCYWQRARSADGTLDSIIANDISTGQVVVTVNATDIVFGTTGCAGWTRIG